ncbi:hypothetical protein KC330_g5437 [Hortaea werneckii]|nr:hypothetical protein KC330_g5437 [Hortaea werneckii]
MSAEHEAEVHDVMRQVLGEMKGINSRLERVETRQKQIEGNIATLVADENLQKLVTPQNAAKIQVQLFVRDNPAAERFCSTRELLERMLLELPVQDLLLAQRVCSRFKATIDGSVKIRRALVFEQEPVAKDGMAVAPRINPLLTEESQSRRRRFLYTESTPSCRRHREKQWCLLTVALKATNMGVNVERDHIYGLSGGATYHSHGSWMRMLVAQSSKQAHSIVPCEIRAFKVVLVQPVPTIGELCNRERGKWFVRFNDIVATSD